MAPPAVDGGFRIGKLFHLTPLVDSLAQAELLFTALFAPFCIMRNYSPHWHRDAAIFVVAETAIEPMQPLAPREHEPATSWYRYMARFGPHVHNLAFYVEDLDDLAGRLRDAGVRITDGGSPGTIFAHPKDTPGMLEFSEPSGEFGLDRADPRFSGAWPAFRDDFWPNWHPLGLLRLSHVTIAVHDADAAAHFYTDVLCASPLPDQPATVGDADARFVLLGEDTVLELARPRDEESLLASELRTVGECVTTVTFTVRDLERAAAHLDRLVQLVAATGFTAADTGYLVLDRARTWGAEYRFTERSLVGDPRLEKAAPPGSR
jgi:catechol 2,3-dioxygenase-like lactoylglutathione lyase family enzyme